MRAVSEGIQEVIDERVRRKLKLYIGAPLNDCTMEAIQAELHALIQTYVGYGEVTHFDPNEIRISVDPYDRNKITVKIGWDPDLVTHLNGIVIG